MPIVQEGLFELPQSVPLAEGFVIRVDTASRGPLRWGGIGFD
jgi:hypothetical protein